jgi:1-deoxy-D-xylulose-5-phosphate reductoisomerase
LSDRKRIAVLGSTGSIGTQTLDVVRQHPDRLQIVALAVGSHVDAMIQQAHEFNVTCCAVGCSDTPHATGVPEDIEIAYGPQAVVDLCTRDDVDLVVNALVGAAGLRASLTTLRAGKTLALANKESLVVGGDLIMPIATHQTLVPIDSEHGAIYQCLIGEKHEEVARLWVTASGGPFRGYSHDDLAAITPAQALAHPTWHMGPKISIDSSTLMNKGLEVIEAHHLFAMDYDRISVVVQPQSAIHSMVEFVDGSVKAHLGATDMRIPIQFALSYPERWSAPVAPIDFCTLGSLEFYPADTKTFRCLDLARSAGQEGGTLPCAMNAANEVAVASFLAGSCSYVGIADTVEAVMDSAPRECVTDLAQLERVDAHARQKAHAFIEQHF